MSVHNILTVAYCRVLRYFLFSGCTEDEAEDFLWLPKRSLNTVSIGKYENLNSPLCLKFPSLYSLAPSYSPGAKQSELWKRYEASEVIPGHLENTQGCAITRWNMWHQPVAESLKICPRKLEDTPEIRVVTRQRCEDKDDADTRVYIHNTTTASAAWWQRLSHR